VAEQYDATNYEIPEQSTGVTENNNDNTEDIMEEEPNPEEYVTLGDINIIWELNSSARHTAEAEAPNNRTNERYSLRPRPTRRVRSTFAQYSKQPVLSVPKTHAHVMLNTH
jgi:hypothetical protein